MTPGMQSDSNMPSTHLLFLFKLIFILFILVCTYCILFTNEGVEKNKRRFSNLNLKMVPSFYTTFYTILYNQPQILYTLPFFCTRESNLELGTCNPTSFEFRSENGTIILCILRTILHNRFQILYIFLSYCTRESNLGPRGILLHRIWKWCHNSVLFVQFCTTNPKFSTASPSGENGPRNKFRILVRRIEFLMFCAHNCINYWFMNDICL